MISKRIIIHGILLLLFLWACSTMLYFSMGNYGYWGFVGSFFSVLCMFFGGAVIIVSAFRDV